MAVSTRPDVARPSPAGFGSPRPSAAPARPRTGGRTQQGAATVAGTASSDRPQPESRSRRQGEAPARPTGGSTASLRPRSPRQASLPDTNYAGVILAEFVGAILVIALAPVASNQQQGGVSPYAGGDMVKLAAATLLYVILGFIATASRGTARIAAWMGGLVLITIGLAEGTTLAKEFGLFTGGLLAASQGTSGGAEGSAGSALAAYGRGSTSFTQAQLTNLGQQEQTLFEPGQGPVPVSLTGQGKPL